MTAVAILTAGFVIGCILFALLYFVRSPRTRREQESILDEAKHEAERIIADAQLKAREEVLRRTEEFERQARQKREELDRMERELSRRSSELESRESTLSKRQRYIENLQNELARREEKVKEWERELNSVLESEKEQLLKISGLTVEEARELLLEKIQKDLERDVAEVVERRLQEAEETARERAKSIIATAIQRCAVEHTADTAVSTVDLPDDNLKGRIIGREGRNIRAFERATGVDVIVDDTPGVVVVSCFDSIRRETARRAMEELVMDGRIHPARIEEVVERKKREMEQVIQDAGRQALMELGLRRMHPKLVYLLGRLKFRTSYGQNVLDHSLEVANIAGLIASELGIDSALARRSGLVHDIGKAVDHQVEGAHAQIGAEVLKRYNEPSVIVDAVQAHHEDMPVQSIYGVLLQAADAISASRPGARRETFEKYVKRLERLEEVANAFKGVENAYAIQAGREVRVVVKADEVDDSVATKLAYDIAREIEKELEFPGEIKVTVLRETRAVEIAR